MPVLSCHCPPPVALPRPLIVYPRHDDFSLGIFLGSRELLAPQAHEWLADFAPFRFHTDSGLDRGSPGTPLSRTGCGVSHIRVMGVQGPLKRRVETRGAPVSYLDTSALPVKEEALPRLEREMGW